MVSQKPFQRLQPLSLLAQLISRRIDGCLQIVSGTTSWLLYLDEGNLAYATNSISPFERLDRCLVHLSDQIPALEQLDRSLLRQRFEALPGTFPSSSSDYQAIYWLVEQQYLNTDQAALLISEIAKDAIKPLLSVTEGMYELIARQNFLHYPTLCRLDLRSLVEECHSELRQRTPVTPTAASVPVSNVAVPTAVPTAVPVHQAQPIAAGVRLASPDVLEAVATKSRHTIACIDDSPTILQAISSFLNDSSISVIMINDPVKALMQVVRCKPDVILLDVGMPNLDGYELCSLIRRHPEFKHTPIIMVTGHTRFIDRAKAKFAGASGYLTKPFTQTELVNAVSKYVGIGS
jgi:twitching motility two-component system response regulator PilG